MTSTAVTWDAIVFAGFVAALAWVPFWFGSNSLFAWGFNAAVFGSLVVGYEFGLLLRARPHPVSLRRIGLPAFCLALAAAWILVQISTLSPESWHHPIWAMTADALGQPLAGSITLSRDLTALALARFVTCACVLWLALQLCRDGARAHRLVLALAVIGTAYAVYGLIAYVVSPDTVLWFPRTGSASALTATFVNRNSYATYAGMTAVAALALFLVPLRAPGYASTWATRAAHGLATLVGGAGLALVALCVIGAALLITGSRAGITASLAGLVGTVLLFAASARRPLVSALLLGIPALVLLLVLLSASGEAYLSGLERIGSLTGDRLAVYTITLDSILASPLLGFGYGTFEHAFRMFRDGSLSDIQEVWDKAHNTPLEAVQGLGIPAAALLLIGLGALALRCLRGALSRERNAQAPLAACGATLLVSLHALFDFSLQIQAVAITWVALLGAGVAQSWSSRTDTSDGEQRPRRAPERMSGTPHGIDPTHESRLA
ncbi:MAG TPA: O-antigen ligase family protein [Microvirga sp.]|nr:O-antigen ligase family protein [Microvirga sp.]